MCDKVTENCEDYADWKIKPVATIANRTLVLVYDNNDTGNNLLTFDIAVYICRKSCKCDRRNDYCPLCRCEGDGRGRTFLLLRF